MVKHTPSEVVNRVRSNSRENKPPLNITGGGSHTQAYVARSNSACTRKAGEITTSTTHGQTPKATISSQLKQPSAQNRSLLTSSASAQKPNQRSAQPSITDPKSPNFMYKPRQRSVRL